MSLLQYIRGLRIQYASNLTNIKNCDYTSIVYPIAPYLVLPCIVQDKQFIEYCSKHWKKVFLLQDTESLFKNVYNVNYGRYDLENGITFIGCTDHHTHEQWLQSQLELCAKNGQYAVVLTSRVPLANQDHLLQFPVKAWLAGIHDCAFVDTYTTIPVYIASNPWNKPNYSNKVYVEITTDPFRPDECDMKQHIKL